jgi:hypothetical protein
MDSFNFDRFEMEFENRQLMGTLVNILRDLRAPGEDGADGDRLIQAEEGTPLHGLMNRLRVGDEPPPEEFDFELQNHLTLEQAMQRCNQARADPQRMFITVAQRAMFNINLDRNNAAWVEVSRPENREHTQELQACHFLDKERTVIDWRNSLPELKRIARERLYTNDMMVAGLKLLVDKFCSTQKGMIKDLNANQIANFLLRLEKNRDRTSYRRAELMKLTREPGQELRAALTMADALIDQIYPADRPEVAPQRSFAKRTAILSFLPDQLALPLSNKIKRSMELCTPLSDDVILRLAHEAEEVSRIRPSTPLQFGRLIGATPAANHIQFNSMQSGNQFPSAAFGNHLDAYGNPAWLGLPPPVPGPFGPQMAAYGNPYAVYPPWLPPAEPPAERRPRERSAVPASQAQQAQATAQATARGRANATQATARNGPMPVATSTPSLRVTEAASSQSGEDSGEVLVNDPSLSPEEAAKIEAARKQLFDSSHQLTSAAMDTLPDGYLNEVSDIVLPEDNGGEWTLVQSRSKKSCRLPSAATPAKTRSQAANAEAASQPVDEVILSSINIQQLAPEVISFALKVAGAVSSQKSEKDQSYKRGQVQNGRYSSRDRDQSRGRSHEARGRSEERGRSQRDSSQRRYPSKGRDESYRGQSRGRYPSQDRRNQTSSDSRSYSKSGQDWRTSSRQDNRSYRDQSRDRSQSRQGSQSYRTQSRSPTRREGSASHFPSSRSRASRTPSTGRSSRSSSLVMRQAYSLMRKGENCREDYDPRRQKDCTKCTNPGHHEFECRKYPEYSSQKCHVCRKCYHFADKCRETEHFPPNPGEGSSRELGKN